MFNKLPFHHLRRFALAAFILSFLIAAFGAAFSFINIASNDNDKERSVKLGEEFTLKKGETAKVQGLNVTLTVTGFIYSPCPEGSQCFWSGLAVEYELSADGKIYKSTFGNLPTKAPYRVFIKDSDYKTYATFVIDKSEKDVSGRQSGYLEGIVTVGPLCPIEPCRLSDEDRRIALTSRKIPVYTDQTRILQAMIIPDNQGNYRLELPPGRYLVGDKKYEGNVFSKDLPQEILIEAGKTIRLNINVDTGIR